MEISTQQHEFILPKRFSGDEFKKLYSPIPLFKIKLKTPPIPSLLNSIRRIIINELPRYKLKVKVFPNESLYMSHMIYHIFDSLHVVNADGVKGLLDIKNETDDIMDVTLADVKWNRDLSKQLNMNAVIAKLLPSHSIKYKIYSEFVSDHPDCIGFNMNYNLDKNYIEYLTHFKNSAQLAIDALKTRLTNLTGTLNGTKSGAITSIKFIGETMTVTNLLVEYIKYKYPKVTYINTSTDPANVHILYIRHNTTDAQMELALKQLISEIK